MNTIVWLIGTGEQVLAAIVLTAFILLYATTARWWKSEIGRMFMATKIVLALVLWLAVVSNAFLKFGSGIPDPLTWVRLGVFGLVPVVFIWLLALYIRKVVVARKRPGD